MYYIEEIIKEATIAENNGDVPVGAIVVKNNEIIGRGHNERYKNNDVTNHAEIIAIREAAKYLNDWRLNDCDLYVTLEPCNMCKEIIRESRIKNVYYLLNKEYKNNYNTNICSININEEIRSRYQEQLTNFFIDNCNR